MKIFIFALCIVLARKRHKIFVVPAAGIPHRQRIHMAVAKHSIGVFVVPEVHSWSHISIRSFHAGRVAEKIHRADRCPVAVFPARCRRIGKHYGICRIIHRMKWKPRSKIFMMNFHRL